MIENIQKRTTASYMTDDEWSEAIQEWPKNVIGSNSKLRKTHFWQWSIPALSAAVVRNNASQPELKNIGLVYHGVITLDKAFSDADMGQGILLD